MRFLWANAGQCRKQIDLEHRFLASRDRRWEFSGSGILKAGLEFFLRLREENPNVKAGPSKKQILLVPKGPGRF